MDISLGKRVLILDNDRDCRNWLMDVLVSEGFRVAGAYDLQQGERILVDAPVDIVLMAVQWLDLQMLERLEMLREKPYLYHAPMILMIHFSNVMEFSPDLRHLDCELLLKPFQKKELLACITKVTADRNPSKLTI